MKEIVLRPANTDDYLRICNIIYDSMGYENPPQIVKNNLNRILTLDTDKIFVAQCEDCVGFIHGEKYNSLYTLPLVDIVSFAVKKDYQRKNIGSMLIRKLEEWANECGCGGMRVLSDEKFAGAHKFYTTHGYNIDKLQMNFQKYF